MLQHVHDNTPLSNCIHKGIAVVLDIEHIKVAISVWRATQASPFSKLIASEQNRRRVITEGAALWQKQEQQRETQTWASKWKTPRTKGKERDGFVKSGRGL